MTQGGHVPHKVKVMKRLYENGEYTEEVIELEDVIEDTTDIVELSSKSTSSCQQNENESGFASWENVSAAKIKIVNRDGSEFEEGMAGLSQDKKSIEAFVVCKNEGNSMIICTK